MRQLLWTLLGVLLWVAPVDAAISYVGGQTGFFAGTTTTQTITFALTNGSDATPAAGDVVVVTFCTGSTVDRTLDIETTGAIDYIGIELYVNDTIDVNMRVAYRFMPASPETQFRFAGGSGNNADGATWTVHVFRGVSQTRFHDVTLQATGGLDTHLANPPAITPVTAGTYVVVCGCGALAAGANFTTSGMTDTRLNTSPDTNDSDIGTGYVAWTSGAVDIAQYGAGGTGSTNNSWGAVVLALRAESSLVLRDRIGKGVLPAKR